MMRVTKQAAAKYALGVLAAIAALLLRKVLDPFLGSDNPYHTAWLAVAFSAWYCGLGPAIVSVAMIVVGIWYWFLPPFGSFHVQSQSEVFGMFGFLAFSVVIVIMGESARRNVLNLERVKEQLRKVQDLLEDRVRERTAALEKSAAALQEKTAELAENAAMLDSANDAIFVRTPADEISYWNKGAERLYGWTKEEALGGSPHELLHTQFPIPLAEIQARESWEGELRQNRRDGSRIIVTSHWTTLRDASGNATGWLEINTDVTSRKRAESTARSLSARILNLQDDERRRIARELHDSLGQYLAALKMNLDGLALENGEQGRVAADCSNLVAKCLTETRTISHLLHPPLLDELGLSSAARWYVDEFARRSGIAVNFDVSPELERLNSDVELALFRALQEGMTNVHRHSGATSVQISLTLKGKQVLLGISDNGRGIPQEQLSRFVEGATEAGVGLAGLRERLRELDGSMELRSDATGTRLMVRAPISSAPMEPDMQVA
jgi:PAS domain S-box-containing protein